jgi:hypothetical protein
MAWTVGYIAIAFKIQVMFQPDKLKESSIALLIRRAIEAMNLTLDSVIGRNIQPELALVSLKSARNASTIDK